MCLVGLLRAVNNFNYNLWLAPNLICYYITYVHIFCTNYGVPLLLGKYIKQAQTMRAKAQLEKLQSQIASTARKTGISSATKLALLAPGAEVVNQ